PTSDLSRPTSTSHIYPLSLHDALPILDQELDLPLDLRDRGVGRLADRCVSFQRHDAALQCGLVVRERCDDVQPALPGDQHGLVLDRKSTRLNSSHVAISYAVFCLKKKT